MNLLFIGPQGSGKGTQAKLVSEKFGIPHISTGNLLRNATGDLRKDINSYIITGDLYPDEKMLKLLKERLAQKDCKKGYVLDGFPRNLKQSEMLDEITEIDTAVEIYISDEESVKRVSSRMNCEVCGEVYNMISKPPKKEGICDKCSTKLTQRDDDKPSSLKKRLATYHKETEPVLKRYNSVRVNGEQIIEKVTRDIIKLLKEI